MNRFWKIGLTIGAVLVLAVAAVGFVSAQTDNDVPGTDFVARLAEKLGITQEELQTAIDETQLDMVDDAVANDKLTEEQGDRLRDRIESGEGLRPFRGFRFGFEFGFGKGFHVGRGLVHIGEVLEDVGELLGTSVEELRDALSGGQSLAEIAEAHGVSEEDLKAFLVGLVEDHLAEAVENGGLSQEQADEALERASELIDRLVNQEGVGTLCLHFEDGGRLRGCLPGGFGHFEWFGRPCEPESESDGVEGTTF